jgi:hypothetical protein
MVSLTFYDFFSNIFFFLTLLVENCIFFYIWVTSIFVWFMIDITVMYVDYFNNKHNYVNTNNNVVFLFFINKFFKTKNVKTNYLKLVSLIL